MDLPRWDLFCRVVDNHGDIGVCWRLAADLAARGVAVRLWVDDASALRWMAPHGAAGVTVLGWPGAGLEVNVMPGEVVIEAFGCELPANFARRMAQMPRAPVWINLEYLSAEPFVERVHRLPSPQPGGPGAGLRKWFFYPGFTERTGGLIREPDLASRQRAFEAEPWLQAQGVQPRAGEQRVSLFCYEQAALPALLERLTQQPTLLLATHGAAARQVAHFLGAEMQRGGLRARILPALTQRDYDHLLWSCDLNFVRGEDSFVRAQWAGKPFVWQIYPQNDGAHSVKLAAFLARFLANADPELGTSVGQWWRAWNEQSADLPALPSGTGWSSRCVAWRDGLLAQSDLTTQLLGFATESR
jgi:uncharacterized repeat protein (TIGR03837 family)